MQKHRFQGVDHLDMARGKKRHRGIGFHAIIAIRQLRKDEIRAFGAPDLPQCFDRISDDSFVRGVEERGNGQDLFRCTKFADIRDQNG